VDVRFGFPICTGVLGVGMAESNVDAGNFFVLQNVADYARQGGVRADGKFADTIAVFVGAGVSAKIVEQFLIFAAKLDNAIVGDLDRQRRVAKIAVLTAKIIANHAIDQKRAVGVRRRSENFATGEVAPFFGS